MDENRRIKAIRVNFELSYSTQQTSSQNLTNMESFPPKDIRNRCDDVRPSNRPEQSHILEVVIDKADQLITTDTLYKITIPLTKVVRIVIKGRWTENNVAKVYASIELSDPHEANLVKKMLDGANIYDNCCTLHFSYAPPHVKALTVTKNDALSWDYTRYLLTPEEATYDQRSKRSPSLSESPPSNSKRQRTYYNEDADQVYWAPPLPDDQRDTRPPPPPSSESPSVYEDPGGSQGRFPPVARNVQNSYNPSQNISARFSVGQVCPNFSLKHLEASEHDLRSGVFSHRRVCLIYGLAFVMDPMKVFNLLCIYGDVIKVKFLSKVPGAALVEMANPDAAWRVINNLNGLTVLGNVITIKMSNQESVCFGTGFGAAHRLLMNGAPMCWDFSNCGLFRFVTPADAAKNRIVGPCKVLHFYDFPKYIDTSKKLYRLLRDQQCPKPVAVEFFAMSKAKPTMCGLLEFASIADSSEALVKVNNLQLDKYSVIKLCYSVSKLINPQVIQL